MGDSEATLLAFWLPDLILLAAASFVAAGFCFLESRLTAVALWFVAGAVAYASLYCLAFAFLTDSGWLGVALMFPAMVWSGVFATALSAVGENMFRVEKTARTRWILIKTFAQIIIVWSVILVVFPFLIVRLEDKLGVSRFAFPFQTPLAIALFAAISLLGVASAVTMSKIGKGTPLPLDNARNLVVAGTYAFVRNPMAISGVGQSLVVGLLLGSPLVLLYGLMGGLIWQLIFRPLEEANLHTRFGAEYEDYRRQVRCWIPNRNSYKPQ
jgi:protein-S-isoprenylcysteine O-methyltransferase Ste14